MQTMHTRPLLMAVITIVALLMLSGVAYALGRSLGYIPGIGIVDQSVPIRVLAEPVIVQEQGITVRVSEVVADSTFTFLAYRLDGIPLAANGMPACAAIAKMHLPDGTNLEDKSGSGGTAVLKNGNTVSYKDEQIYSPIPNGTNNVIFVLSCVLPDGSDLQKLELPIQLAPAPAGFATPAVEIAVTADDVRHETGLHLERVLDLAGSYILIGKFTDAGDLPGPLYMTTSSDSEYLPHIEDADGNPVSFRVREDIRSDPDWDVAYYWAYEISKPVATPLKITVDRISIRKYSMARVPFDPGDDPQMNEEWKLNRPVTVGVYTFVLETITFVGNGYVLNLSYNDLPESVSFYVDLLDSSLSPYQFDNIDSKETHSGNKAIQTITFTAKNPLPAGKLIVEWQLEETIPHAGPWSLTWTPVKTNP